MAGLCAVKILLLWTGIVGLNECEALNTTVAALNTTATASTASPTNSSQTDSPAGTVLQTSQAVAPLQCSYTVTPIKFGIEINISSAVTSYNASIEIKEKGKSVTKTFTVARNSSHLIKPLKPCTEYEHYVTLGHQATPCSTTENQTVTTQMSQDEVNVFNCNKSLCYQTEWNISSLQGKPDLVLDLSCGNNTFCFKPGYNNTCSDFTLNFPSKACTTPFNITSNIDLGLLDPRDIHPIRPNRLPANIEINFPPKCNNLSADYTCWEEHHRDKEKTLSELEPFTLYTCMGHIKDNNVPLFNTTAFPVQIRCGLDLKITKETSTNTSIELTWNMTSSHCNGVIQNFSYNCQCSDKYPQMPTVPKQHSERNCTVSQLNPFTKYNCSVQVFYKNSPRLKQHEVSLETKIGVPPDVSELSLKVKDHNTIRVTCTPPQKFNGPKKGFNATLLSGPTVKKVLNETSCDFEFKDLEYSTNYTVKVTAANNQFESKPKIKHITTDYNDKPIIGILVFLIIFTSVALLLVVYKIYVLKRRKSRDLSENLILISPSNEEENLLPVEPIAAELLLETYKRKLADEGRLFLAEFQSIPRIFSRHSVKEAKRPCNVPKNRYVDILPYDYNRVQLTTGNGEAGCDYINASFIDGYKEAKKYIAAQGPKDESVGDFWRMVWEQQSSIIVMVTRCEEGNRVKCAQYWPSAESEAEIFEEFIVKLNSEELCPDYTIRHLSITNKREKNSEREVTHIQFMSWPDHGVPAEPHLLLKLRRRVNAFNNFFSGPIVVHCSAGVGRTGTYIGIDAMMEALETEGRVDIYGYMVRLRKQRCLMVQVEAQYILIHQALVEHNQFGETEIPLSELHSTLNTLKQINSESELTLMEEEFDRLPTFQKWKTFNAGITAENREKNRSPSVLPYDYNRVLLKMDEGPSGDSDHGFEGEESSDEEDEESCRYINASHINSDRTQPPKGPVVPAKSSCTKGYWAPHGLIAAQTPLPDTMADFWLMVYQKRMSTVVMLSEENKESGTVCWDNGKRTFGDLEVEVVSTVSNPTFISRNLLIHSVKRTERCSVKHFQFLKWGNKELPETPQCLADMMKEMKNSGRGNKSQATLVHCNDGSSRSGVFCALWNLLDSIQTEKVVDVFQVVKILRKERQNMISSLEQYQFLYDVVQTVFPVQNGEVKAAQASAADSVQMIRETKAAEQPDSTASSQQQGAAESADLAAEEEKREEPDKESWMMEDTSNGPAVRLEV